MRGEKRASGAAALPPAFRSFLRFLPAFLLCARLGAGEAPPRAEDSVRVHCIVSELEEISRSSRSLEEFGKRTMTQGREILEMGPAAVYELSRGLQSPDPKVRFWIVDILGYLECEAARRPLLRAAGDERESPAVRERARRSLEMREAAGRVSR